MTDVFSHWLEDARRELGLDTVIQAVDADAIARRLTSVEFEQPSAPGDLVRLASLYESEGIAQYRQWIGDRDAERRAHAEGAFGQAFAAWRSLVTLPRELWRDVGVERSGFSDVGAALAGRDLDGEAPSADLAVALHIAATGLLAGRSAETQLELTRFALLSEVRRGWRDMVLASVIEACCLLVRKADGWDDIEAALSRIDVLRNSQALFEDEYLAASADDDPAPALELVGLYHLAQLVTVAGSYLARGDAEVGSVELRLDRHRDRAIDSVASAGSGLLAPVIELVWATSRELIRNSIWTHVRHLGPSVAELARVLAAQGRPHPVIELWPSQQLALQRSLLDPYPRAALIELPTSAGKTLLAKFVIAQTHALNPDVTVAYVVPTRALVNQITRDLRPDMAAIGMSVEQSVPAMDIDPTENRLLQARPDVLVTTPEKLDLLLRSGHSSTAALGLVIADEAHNLQDGDRGARLELVLGTIKRDRPNARFLLLSPFLPNGRELLAWLGDERSLPPIALSWRPSRRAVGIVEIVDRSVVLTSLKASGNDLPTGYSVPLVPPVGRHLAAPRTISGISAAAVRALVDRGPVLVYCKGKGTAEARAEAIADGWRRAPARSPDRESVAAYLDAELGRRSPLSDRLEQAVAHHHAGMSPEARILIERLARTGQLDVVCGTTTLAQGVNFPFTSVVFETLLKGRDASGVTHRLSYQDFWNIAGRAGRALVDPVGLVAFVAADETHRAEFASFLEGEATEISSQLARLLTSASDLATEFNLALVARWPELSPLLQFLSHAMRVSATGGRAADEVDDILRASLVFHQARRQGDVAVSRLVEVCRRYLVDLEGKSNWHGLATLADKTGFSTPSVLRVLAATSADRTLRSVDSWQPDKLFGSNLKPLTDRVAAIANLPEIELGQGSGGPFNPERVAAILRDWVTGATISELTADHAVAGRSARSSTHQEERNFQSYLFSTLLMRASWGLGALEGVALSGRTDEPGDEAFVPSLVYYGVPRKQEVWMRMIGVPRIFSRPLADEWASSVGAEPQSFGQVRNWVGTLPQPTWESLERTTGLAARDAQLILSELAG